jgi:hypothetical protein
MTQSVVQGQNASSSTLQVAWSDPSVDGPKLAFNNGQVTGVTEDLNPVLPNIAGPVSSWHITQWNPGSWFDPATMIVDPPLVDPVLGSALYQWNAIGSSLSIFGAPGNYIYALTDGNGNLRDLNLETGAYASANYTFDKQVTFTADERIAAAADNGPVDGATAANNFTVAFNRQDSANYDPSLPTISIFLQIELSVAGAVPKAYASFGTSAGNIYNVVPGGEGNNYLAGNPDGGALHQVTINLSSAVAQMTRWLATADPSAGNAVLDLSKWSLTSAYIGIEASTGSTMTLDVAHPVVTRDPNLPTVVQDRTVAITNALTESSSVLVDVSSLVATPSKPGVLGAGETISFTLTGTSSLVQTGGNEQLLLSDGSKAKFAGIDANGALTFTDTIATGDQASDLKVIGLSLNGSTIGDRSGATLDLATMASASGDDTGIAIDATAPILVGGSVAVPVDGGVLTITGNLFAAARPALVSAAGASQATAGLNIMTASGTLAVSNGLGVVAVQDNAPSSTIIVGDGDSLLYSGSSNATIIAGAGRHTVFGGSGNDVVALGGGANQIVLGAGDNVVRSEGADLIQAGSGHDTVTVTGTNATINGGYGSSTLLVDDSAGSNTLIKVSAGATITGASASVTTINAYGDTTVSGGAGGTVYNEQNGTLKFVGLGGSVTVTGGPAAGNDTLYGASGANIVLASQAHDNIFVANDPHYGADGDVTLNGAQAGGGNEFWAGSGNATLIGGSGGDTLVGGMGAATVIGGAGSNANAFDLFANNSGAATDMTIENFGAVAGNRLTLFGFGRSAVADAIAQADQTGAGTTLHLANGATIVVEGVTLSQLTPVLIGAS